MGNQNSGEGPSPFISELLASRLCHELVGPVGAISNGVEFAEEVEDGAADAIGLIGESAHRASGRLQFYRLAYGSAGRSVRDPLVIRDAIAALIAYERAELDWFTSNPSADFSGAIDKLVRFLDIPGGAKLVLIAAEIAYGALIRGGTIQIRADEEISNPVKSPGIVVTASGTKAAVPPEIVSAWTEDTKTTLEELPENLTPRTVHCFYARSIAQQAGLSLELMQETDVVRLTLK